MANTNSTKLQSIHKKLLAVQKELPKLKKDAENPFHKSKYVTLDNLLAHVLPILNKHGLLLVQSVGTIEVGDSREPALSTTIFDEQGTSVSDSMLLLQKSADPQAQGSAITYARRYALTTILGIAAEEDDDAEGTKPNGAKPVARPTGGATGTYATARPLPSRPISQPQRKYLFRLINDNEFSSEEAEKIIKQFAGVKSLNDLTSSQASTLIGDLQKMTVDEMQQILNKANGVDTPAIPEIETETNEPPEQSV